MNIYDECHFINHKKKPRYLRGLCYLKRKNYSFTSKVYQQPIFYLCLKFPKQYGKPIELCFVTNRN